MLLIFSGYYIIAILGILISIAAAIGLYQRYGIGTMYQRWECRRGSTGTSEYWYWLQVKMRTHLIFYHKQGGGSNRTFLPQKSFNNAPIPTYRHLAKGFTPDMG